MVVVQYHGGMGNRLFQYAYGRLLAEAKGYALLSPEGSELRERGFPQVSQAVTGKKVADPVIYVLPENRDGVPNSAQENPIDPQDLSGKLPEGKIWINGFFQHYRFYARHRRKILDWFRTDIALPDGPGPGDLVIYIQSFFNVGSDFYCRILRKKSWDRLWAVVNHPERSWNILTDLRKFEPKVFHSRDHLVDFEFLRQAKRMILAPSTFAWWAAWLSEAEEITMARPSEGYGSRSHGVAQLEVGDLSSWRYENYRV